jgi:hypothetical protein
MVNDVETVLREIRERVIAENEPGAPVAVISSASPATHSPTDSNQTASLDRLSAELAITARAWDRLPPLVSNRRGALGRLEISLKRIFKPLTRWFTWEQINFNAAVHHALLDALAVVKAQDEQLRAFQQVQAGIEARVEIQANELRAFTESNERRSAELKERLELVDATLKRYSEMMAELAEEMRKGHADLTREVHERFPEMASTLESALKKLDRDFNDRLAASIAEISADFRAEQRVCFKQLSLETSEAAILEDRGRRALESRVEKLERDSQPSK